jgi:ubiquinone/menaquinone biosynthesis C-methylase UbiE
MSNFEYWARHADVSAIHDEAMAGLTSLETARVLAAYDFSHVGKIVDVGGGNGSFLATLLRHQPQASGVLADLSHVVAQATEQLQHAGVRERCEIVGGDFFETVPPGGDLYVLKHIIHDWDDERARRILQNCHRAMKATAQLLIIDCVLPPEPTPETAMGYLADMTMLIATPGGRERTQADFQQLLASAGFELTRLIRAGGLADLVEARKR